MQKYTPFKEKTTDNAFLKIKLAFEMGSYLERNRSIKNHVDYDLFMATEYNQSTLGERIQRLAKSIQYLQEDIDYTVDYYQTTLEKCKK